MSGIRNLYDAVVAGDAHSAVCLTREGLEGRSDPAALFASQLRPGLEEAGRRFEAGEYYLPEFALSVLAARRSLALLHPLLIDLGVAPAGRVVIGTVAGELHDIGKNLVAAVLETGGFEVTDLGTDVPPQRFIEAARCSGADILCLSALLTVNMDAMKRTLDALGEAGIRKRAKVLVGGAPITQQYADEIGADGYGENALAALRLARRIMAARAGAAAA